MTTSSQKPHVVIVGAGFGGINAARSLRNANVTITVIDRRNHHLFQPLLYQVATASLSPADIAQPIRSILRKQPNVKAVLMATVTNIDLKEQRVDIDGESIPFDFLILATGARHAYFGHDEWERDAPGLKSLEDALEIRRRILLAFEDAERMSDENERIRLLTFVVVGGGPTGTELAGALAEISRQTLANDFDSIDPTWARIYLFEAGPRILSMFPEKLSDKAYRYLNGLGVQVRTGTPVTAVSTDGVVAGGRAIPAATVLWAAGVTASPLGKSLGVPLDRAGRVQVLPDLTIPGHTNVFVIGDLASLSDSGGNLLPGVAQVAMQQGSHAALNIRRSLKNEPLSTFEYSDKGNMATIGRNKAVAEIRGRRLSGFVAWVAWLWIHIYFLIGFRNRLGVILNWAWSYVTFNRGARLITSTGYDQSREIVG